MQFLKSFYNFCRTADCKSVAILILDWALKRSAQNRNWARQTHLMRRSFSLALSATCTFSRGTISIFSKSSSRRFSMAVSINRVLRFALFWPMEARYTSSTFLLIESIISSCRASQTSLPSTSAAKSYCVLWQ